MAAEPVGDGSELGDGNSHVDHDLYFVTPTLGGQLGFSIEGYTYSHDAVARLLTRLAVVPDLQQVQLITSEQAKLGDRTIIHFKISANVRAPGASS